MGGAHADCRQKLHPIVHEQQNDPVGAARSVSSLSLSYPVISISVSPSFWFVSVCVFQICPTFNSLYWILYAVHYWFTDGLSLQCITALLGVVSMDCGN